MQMHILAHLGSVLRAARAKKTLPCPLVILCILLQQRHHAPLLCVLAASPVLAPCPLSLIRALLLQLRFFFLLVSAFPPWVMRNSSFHTLNKRAF